MVINRNFQHEDEYKNVSQSVLSELVNNKCADFAVLSDEQSSKMKEKENKVAVEDPDDPNGASKDGKKGDNGDGSRAGGIASNNKHSQAATGHNCFTQLHVILNRRFKDNIGDYAHSGCLDQDGRTGTQQQTVKSAGSDSKTALAQSRMNKVIMDTHATNYMKSQHNLSPLE